MPKKNKKSSSLNYKIPEAVQKSMEDVETEMENTSSNCFSLSLRPRLEVVFDSPSKEISIFISLLNSLSCTRRSRAFPTAVETAEAGLATARKSCAILVPVKIIIKIKSRSIITILEPICPNAEARGKPISPPKKPAPFRTIPSL